MNSISPEHKPHERKNVHRPSDAKDLKIVKDLKLAVRQATDPEELLDAQCKLVLFSARDVGADVDRLISHTGCPRAVVEAISDRMRQAGLWVGLVVDDQEWWDQDGNLSWVFSAHALVAQGKDIRECTDNGGYRYFRRETGDLVMEWS